MISPDCSDNWSHPASCGCSMFVTPMSANQENRWFLMSDFSGIYACSLEARSLSQRRNLLVSNLLGKQKSLNTCAITQFCETPVPSTVTLQQGSEFFAPAHPRDLWESYNPMRNEGNATLVVLKTGSKGGL